MYPRIRFGKTKTKRKTLSAKFQTTKAWHPQYLWVNSLMTALINLEFHQDINLLIPIFKDKNIDFGPAINSCNICPQ